MSFEKVLSKFYHVEKELQTGLSNDWRELKTYWFRGDWRPGRNVTDFLLNCALQISLLN